MPSFHSIKDREKDLEGKYVLISDRKHFYYSGSKPETLPDGVLSNISAGRYFRKLEYDNNKNN